MYGSVLREAVNELFSGVSGAVHEFPPVNVFTNENGAVVRAELPGVNADQLELTVANNLLTLKGNRVNDDVKDGVKTLRRERLHGQFVRALNLPFKVDGAGVSAHFDKGLLTVTLPRAESDKPRKIAITE